jgi:hypothetical protein
MAARTVLTSNTLEEFRTTFNSLSTTDIGDPATLTTVATSVVGAINELNASSYSGFTIVDSGSSTTQAISSGDTLTFAGDSNISAAVTATDTITFTLNSTITGLTSLDATTLTEGGVQVATRPFAIAQAVALG